MQTLIDEFETIARHGPEGLSDVKPVDLEDAVRRAWSGIETANASLEADTNFTPQADPEALGQLLDNLLRNAIEHGGRNVTVTVHSMTDGFAISDDGPGIPSRSAIACSRPAIPATIGERATAFASSRSWPRLTVGTFPSPRVRGGGARFAFHGVQTA